MPSTDPRRLTAQRIARTEAYAAKIQRMFSQTVNELLALPLSKGDVGNGTMYSFDAENERMQRRVEQLLRQLQAGATLAIQKGITTEWEEANRAADAIISRKFTSQALYSLQMIGWNNRSGEAMQQFIARSDRGMNLSQRVWQSCRQLRDEMEVALTISIGEGEDAGTISRRVRQYLNDPDLMFRRFRYKDDQGRWQTKWKKRIADPDRPGRYRFIDYDKDSYRDQWTGRGYYKSSAQNAMRVARTETNIAYRRADHERWQQLDFVIGQRVQLSKKHPCPDICDTLAGDYPKDFVFDGWHPQCFCFVTPILIDQKEIERMNEAFARGEEYTPKAGQITEYPQGFKDFCIDNADKIRDARLRGTEPYFVRNNADVVERIINPKAKPLTIAEKAKLRHEARTEEEKQNISKRYAARKEAIETGKEYGKKFKGIKDVDISTLEDAMRRADWDSVRIEVAKLKEIEAEVLALDKLDNPMEVARKFSVAEAKTVNAAVISRMEREKFSTLEDKKKWLESEIKWTETHKKYTTWEVARDAYKKELAKVERAIEVKGVSDKVKDAILFAKTQSTDPILKALATEMETALADAAISLDELKIKVADLNAKYSAEYDKVKVWIDLHTKAATAIAYASNTTNAYFKKKANEINLMLSSRSLAISTAIQKVNEFIKEYQELYKKEITAKYGTSPVKTIDDVIAELGDKTPKTLKELADALSKYKFTSAEYKAHEVQINALMKKLFEENDLGMDIKASYLESMFANGFYNTFQSGSSMGYKGSSRTSGKIESTHKRLSLSHEMFMPSTHGGLSGRDYNGTQLSRSEYEKYGHLLDRDKYDCYENNRTWYGGSGNGSVQVRFRKDRVLCTWSYDDTLNIRGSGRWFQPSLVTDPRVESFDTACRNKLWSESLSWNSVHELQDEIGTSYIELQFHGELTIDMVESLTFAENPEKIISAELIDKLLKKGIELWYIDTSNKIAVRYVKP